MWTKVICAISTSGPINSVHVLSTYFFSFLWIHSCQLEPHRSGWRATGRWTGRRKKARTLKSSVEQRAPPRNRTTHVDAITQRETNFSLWNHCHFASLSNISEVFSLMNTFLLFFLNDLRKICLGNSTTYYYIHIVKGIPFVYELVYPYNKVRANWSTQFKTTLFCVVFFFFFFPFRKKKTPFGSVCISRW